MAAAWLHDIGYSPDLRITGMHSVDSAVWLSARGHDPLVVSLVAFHTGAEYEAEERGLVRELGDFDRPPQGLLDALTLCDLTVSPTGRRTDVESRIEEITQRYDAGDPVHLAVRRSADYLRVCCARATASAGSPEEGDVAAL